MDTRKRDSIWQEVKKFLDSFCPVKFLTEGVLPQFLLAIIHLISATKLKPKNTRVRVGEAGARVAKNPRS
jgi:hypothetical protein